MPALNSRMIWLFALCTFVSKVFAPGRYRSRFGNFCRPFHGLLILFSWWVPSTEVLGYFHTVRFAD